MNDSWSLNEGKFTMRFSLTVALFIAVGCFSLVGSEPDTPARNATVGTQPGGDTVNSGPEGTTSSVVMSGIPGGKTTGGPASMEIAVAPREGDKPSFAKAIFARR